MMKEEYYIRVVVCLKTGEVIQSDLGDESVSKSEYDEICEKFSESLKSMDYINVILNGDTIIIKGSEITYIRFLREL